VDLHCAEGTPVYAIEPGVVVAVEDFTGPKAGFPWWLDTQAVLVEGASGVLLYGELRAAVEVGAVVEAGARVGEVARVLRHDKGRPTSMLHFERYVTGTRASVVWALGEVQPACLLDPTELLERLGVPIAWTGFEG
jgi:murein DD-endopeptidase MepM/ murein hydrolase activator NlpD